MNVNIFMDELIKKVPKLKKKNMQKKLQDILQNPRVGVESQDDLKYVKESDLVFDGAFSGIEARKIQTVWKTSR